MEQDSDATPKTVTQLAEDLKGLREQLREVLVANEKTVNAYNAFCETTRQSYILILEHLSAGRNTEAIAYLTQSLADWDQDEDDPTRH
jgi:hypothetical protein